MQFVRQASSDNAAARLAKLAKSQTATVGGIEAILSSNKQWAEQMHKTDPTFFDKCGAGQAPKYLWIGCADSRVPAAQLMGLAPGEVFVHRNIAGLGESFLFSLPPSLPTSLAIVVASCSSQQN